MHDKAGEPLDFDVIICGGGPGGSACAMGFVDSGIRVAVIEKSSFPREKVCGDGMAPYISKALHKMSPKFKAAFDQFDASMPITHIRIVNSKGKSATQAFPEPWFVASRYHFDHFLYQQAAALPNVSYLLEEQVTQVSVAPEAVSVQTNKGRYTAKLLIGCDGASSLVGRQLSQYRLDPAHNYAAVRAYYEQVEDVLPDTFEFHPVPQHPSGYFWIFPSENDRANVGFSILSEDLQQKNLKLREVLPQIIAQTPHLNSRFKNARLIGGIKGWSIPVGYGHYPISGARYMLAGDAASVADPLTGEGIGQAIVTGRMAAFQARQCFEANDFSAGFMKQYDKAVHQKWGTQNRRRKLLGHLIQYQWIINTIVALLRSSAVLSKPVLWVLTKIAR